MPKTPPFQTCVAVSELFPIQQMRFFGIMGASRFSSDGLELFYGSILQEENRRQKRPNEPVRVPRERYFDFEPRKKQKQGLVI